ncbi:hypothetical protein KCP74_02590 [Salmonella enterica subsp. enterica]|nr:hypothetical protein KCP74_02590 [Salmonella enterica subsp. enterica]
MPVHAVRHFDATGHVPANADGFNPERPQNCRTGVLHPVAEASPLPVTCADRFALPQRRLWRF